MEILAQKSLTQHSDNPFPCNIHVKEVIRQKNPQGTPTAKTALKAMGILATLSASYLSYQYYGTTSNKTFLHPIFDPIGTALKIGAVAVFAALGAVAICFSKSNEHRPDQSETKLKENEGIPTPVENPELNDDETFLITYMIDFLIQKNELKEVFSNIEKYGEKNPEIIKHLCNCVLKLKEDFDRANRISTKKLLFNQIIEISHFIVDLKLPSSSTFIKDFIPKNLFGMVKNFMWQKDEISKNLTCQTFTLIYKVITKQVKVFFFEDADKNTKAESYVRIFDLIDVELIDAGETYSYTNFIHDSPNIAWKFAQQCLEPDYIKTEIAPWRLLYFIYEEDIDLKKVIIGKAKNCLFFNEDEHAAAFAIKYIQRELRATSELTNLPHLNSLYFQLCDKSCLNKSDEDLMVENLIDQNDTALALGLINLAREIHEITFQDSSEEETSSQDEFEITNGETRFITGS